MRFMRTALLLAAALVIAMGCTTFKASGLSYVPAGSVKYTVVGDFHTSVWVNEFLGSPAGVKLFNLTADSTEGPVKDAIEAAIKEKGGTGAVNITVVHQASFVNIILAGITGGLYAPGTVIVSGTVIK